MILSIDHARGASITRARARDTARGRCATDGARPRRWAQRAKIGVDVFAVPSDSETWAGKVHPCQALEQYRKAMGIAANPVVVGMAANQLSIADPRDAGMQDVVGFDTAVPQLIRDFAAVYREGEGRRDGAHSPASPARSGMLIGLAHAPRRSVRSLLRAGPRRLF